MTALPAHLSGAHVVGLTKGSILLGIAPELGGSIVYFADARNGALRHWFRPASAETMRSGTGHYAACFPLVPVSGRIRDAELKFDGRIFHLSKNVAGEPNSLHGEGWQRPWKLESASHTEAVLSLDGSAGAWPFPYVARFAYSAKPDGFEAVMALTNAGQAPMPAGIGLHPWFPAPLGRLAADAQTVWQIDERKLFTGKSAPKPAWQFANGQTLQGSDLEHGFSDWDGRAVVDWPDRRGRLVIEASDTLRHLVVYTREPNGEFCVEAVSCSVDAFNLMAEGVSGTGTVVLAPGETLSGTTRFRVEDSA